MNSYRTEPRHPFITRMMHQQQQHHEQGCNGAAKVYECGKPNTKCHNRKMMLFRYNFPTLNFIFSIIQHLIIKPGIALFYFENKNNSTD